MALCCAWVGGAATASEPALPATSRNRRTARTRNDKSALIDRLSHWLEGDARVPSPTALGKIEARARLERRPPAIDRQRDAGDEGRFRGGEPEDGSGLLVGRRHAAGRRGDPPREEVRAPETG